MEAAWFSPEQGRLLWQDYLTRQQHAPKIRYNFPDRKPLDEVSPHRVKVKNTGSEVIPAFACMRIVGVEDIAGNTCIRVEKPTATDGQFLFNGPYEIAVPADATDITPAQIGVGWAYRHGVVTMLGDEPTEPGATFGPIVDSWEIEEGGDQFVVFGRHDFSDRALVGRFNGGGAQLTWGKVVSGSCGWYTVELGRLAGSSDAGSYSGSDDPCNPCDMVTSAGTVDCGIELTYPQPKVEGGGVFVTAYDPESLIVPLEPGTDCIVSKIRSVVGAGSGSGSGAEPPTSGSGSGSGTEPEIWGIVRGLQKHLVQYRERGECCPTTGQWVTTHKTPIIFPGIECDEIQCAECPPGSGSA